MTLTIRFWGTRGSIPSPGPTTVRYGGNTACLELRTPDDWLVVLDAGTGIRELGRSLVARSGAAPVRGDIFLSHAHWDHIQGLPFFAPIFQDGNAFTIWGAKAMQTSVDRVVRDQMSPVVFPVAFEQLAAAIDFREIAEEECEGRGYGVRALRVRHPGGALGYRFAAAGSDRALVYIPDNELDGHVSYADVEAGWRDALVAFARGASVLVHDATYTPDEYAAHRGWGHSTWADAVALALDAEVETLVLFHHKPERTDEEVDALLAECRQAVAAQGAALHVIAAAEGLRLTI